MTRTVEEINRYMRATRPRNHGAIQLKKSWIIWYNALPWFERNLSVSAQRIAHDRVMAFNSVNGAVSTMGAEVERTTIRLGSTGSTVAAWQKVVAVPITGTFDTATRTATIAYQKARGLKPDGVVGQATWGTVPEPKSKLKIPAKKVLVTGAALALGVGAAFAVDKYLK